MYRGFARKDFITHRDAWDFDFSVSPTFGVPYETEFRFKVIKEVEST